MTSQYYLWLQENVLHYNLTLNLWFVACLETKKSEHFEYLSDQTLFFEIGLQSNPKIMF